MDICQIGYDICEFDSLRGLGIDVIGRVHFDNRDRFAIWMGSIGDRTMSTNEWLLTSDFWQFLEPWHGRWCEYEIFIASCTDNIYDLENERWLLGTWLIMLGFMDLGWPRVYRRSTSVLLLLSSSSVIVRTLLIGFVFIDAACMGWRFKFNSDCAVLWYVPLVWPYDLICLLGPLLPTWFKIDSSMEKKLHAH